MTGRFLLFCGALLMFMNLALGDGAYQRTRDGETLVWNNFFHPGDEATWSGARDRDGYARGFGTLTWYSLDNQSAFAEPALYARYWGNMVRGKFKGTVNVHSKRKTHYAIFADGARLTRWAAGPAPSRMAAPAFVGAMQKALVASKSKRIEPEAPAEGPGRIGGASRNQSNTEEIQSSSSRPASTEWSQSAPDIDDSLRILVWPPRYLRARR